MDRPPIYSYPDEVARQWKSERDAFEAQNDKLTRQVEKLVEAVEKHIDYYLVRRSDSEESKNLVKAFDEFRKASSDE